MDELSEIYYEDVKSIVSFKHENTRKALSSFELFRIPNTSFFIQPVLPREYCSTFREVLKYCLRSTEVLTGKYWNLLFPP
jgi:hypothetical protein